MMHAIEKALQDATKIKHKAGGKNPEPRQDYLKKLVVAAADGMPEDEWNKLSPEAQLWVNTAATAYKGNEEIPDFPPVDPAAPAAPAAQSATGKPKVAKPAKASNGDDDASGTRRLGGASGIIKLMMLENPNISAADIKAGLEAQGAKVSDLTITTVRSDFRQTLKFLKEEGKLVGVVI
jgi:hypothetical protein